MAQTQLDLKTSSNDALRGQADAQLGQAGAEAVTEVLRRLIALTDVARAADGLDDLLAVVVRTSADALGAPAAAVSLLGAEGRLDRRVSVGFAGDPGGPERLEDGNFGTVVLGEDRVVAVADLETAGLGASPLAQAGMRAALGRRCAWTGARPG